MRETFHGTSVLGFISLYLCILDESSFGGAAICNTPRPTRVRASLLAIALAVNTLVCLLLNASFPLQQNSG